MVSKKLTISGKVQGVFFRANVKRKADELNLKGYAKNLENGNVEITVEGDENKMNEFIDFIKNSPGASKVTNLEVKENKPRNFEEFEVI